MLFDFAKRSPGDLRQQRQQIHKSRRAPENLFCSIEVVSHPVTRKFPEEKIFNGIGFWT